MREGDEILRVAAASPGARVIHVAEALNFAKSKV
jgi:hypothetical protein